MCSTSVGIFFGFFSLTRWLYILLTVFTNVLQSYKVYRLSLFVYLVNELLMNFGFLTNSTNYDQEFIFAHSLTYPYQFCFHITRRLIYTHTHVDVHVWTIQSELESGNSFYTANWIEIHPKGVALCYRQIMEICIKYRCLIVLFGICLFKSVKSKRLVILWLVFFYVASSFFLFYRGSLRTIDSFISILNAIHAIF